MANTLILDSLQFTIDSIKFAEAEKKYQEFLSSGGSRVASAARVDEKEGSESFSLSQQVKLAREQIQSSLKQQRKSPLNTTGGVDPEEEAMLREENSRLKKNVEDLQSQLQKLTERVTKLELSVGTNTPAAPASSGDSNNKSAPPADDDDVDLFGSDEEEEDAEAAKIKEQRLAEYAAKKSKKVAITAKSNVILFVKPWDDETDMKELEKEVRKIVMDGLLWGASKLVPVGYGINKLQIATVIEDDKVSVDELTEKIQDIEDYVQSVDIAAFNKI